MSEGDTDNYLNTPPLTEDDEQSIESELGRERMQNKGEGMDLMKGDLPGSEGILESTSPQKLSPAEQEKAALKEEQKRMRKNTGADRRNQMVGMGAAGAVKGLMNRKQIKQLEDQVKALNNENEKNNKEMADRIKALKKNVSQSSGKRNRKILKIIIEIFTGAGIPLAIWDVVQMTISDENVNAAKKELNEAKKERSKINKKFENEKQRLETKIKNLKSIFKYEAAPAESGRAAA